MFMNILWKSLFQIPLYQILWSVLKSSGFPRTEVHKNSARRLWLIRFNGSNWSCTSLLLEHLSHDAKMFNAGTDVGDDDLCTSGFHCFFFEILITKKY